MPFYIGPQQWWIDKQNRSNIVTDGLVLNLDAGNPASYPGTGTTWYDLSGNGNNVTLFNGIFYDSANQGYLVFDGIDDYATLIPWSWPSNTSVGFFIYVYSNPLRWVYSRIFSTDGDNFEVTLGSSNEISYYTNANSWNTIPTQLISDSWNYVILSQFENSLEIYINGVSSYNGALTINPGTILTFGKSAYGEHLDFKISAFQIYNKTLTQQEVTQNYNALKGRYGL